MIFNQMKLSFERSEWDCGGYMPHSLNADSQFA